MAERIVPDDYMLWVRREADEIVDSYGEHYSLNELAAETERDADKYENGRKMALDIAAELRRRAKAALN